MSRTFFGWLLLTCALWLMLLLGLAGCGQGLPGATPTEAPPPTRAPPGTLRGSVSYAGQGSAAAQIRVELYRSPTGLVVSSTQLAGSGGEYAFPGLSEDDYYVRVWLNRTGHPGAPLPYDAVVWFDPDGDGQPNPTAVRSGGTSDGVAITLRAAPAGTVPCTVRYSGAQSNGHWLTVRALGGLEGRQVLTETSCYGCQGAYTLTVNAQNFTLQAWLDANDNGVLDWPDPSGWYDPDNTGQPFALDLAKARGPLPACDITLRDPAPQNRSGDIQPLGGPTFAGGQVTALAARADVSGTLFAIVGMPGGALGAGGYTANSHIYRTTDGGATWRPVFASRYDLRGLAVLSDTICAVGAGGWNEDLIVVSSDGGMYWTVVFTSTWTATGGYGLQAAAIDPRSPRTIFAAGWQSDMPQDCFGGLIMRSSDGGATWQPVFKTPLTCQWWMSSEFLALAIDPVQGQTVYAAGAQAEGERSLGVIYRSDDGGAHWTLAYSSTVAAAFTSLLIDPITPTILYAGAEPVPPWGPRARRDQHEEWDEGLLFCSTDGGRTWEPCYDKAGLYAALQRPGQLYAATAVDVHRADDAAAKRKWLVGGALPTSAAACRALVADPFVPGKLYAGTDRGGVYISLDGGQTWESQSVGIHTVVYPQAIVVDPQDKRKFFVPGGVLGGYVSQDDGATWTQLKGALEWHSLAIHPADPRIVLAGITGDIQPCILRSSDGGQSWSTVFGTPASQTGHGAMPSIAALSFCAADPRVVYAVGWAYGSPGHDAPVALVSRDAGRSWSPIATLPPGCSELRGVTAHPSRSDSVFFGGSETAADGQGRGTLWRTQDGGTTWQAVQHAQGAFFCVLIDPHDPNVVYACAGQVFKSTDGGATWQVIAEGKDSGRLLALDPLHPERVYNAGIAVFRESGDGGATWGTRCAEFAAPVCRGLDIWPGALTVINQDGVQTIYVGATGVWVHDKH